MNAPANANQNQVRDYAFDHMAKHGIKNSEELLEVYHDDDDDAEQVSIGDLDEAQGLDTVDIEEANGINVFDEQVNKHLTVYKGA